MSHGFERETSFLWTVYLALAIFDEKILSYAPRNCKKKGGLQPTPYEPPTNIAVEAKQKYVNPLRKAFVTVNTTLLRWLP